MSLTKSKINHFYEEYKDPNNVEEEMIKNIKKMQIQNFLRAFEEETIFQKLDKKKQKEEECKNNEELNSNMEVKLKEIYLTYKNNLKNIKKNIKKEKVEKKIKIDKEHKKIESKNQEQNEDLEIIRQRYSHDLDMYLKKDNFWII